MTAAEAFHVLYVLLLDHVQAAERVDVTRVDDILAGWDPEAEERVTADLTRRLHAVI